MQTQIFKIDENRLSNLRNRIIVRNLKIIGLAVVLITASVLTDKGNENKAQQFLFYVPGLLILVIPMYIGISRLMKGYKTLEIILNDNGVETKGDMMTYKAIRWENLIIEEKSNGGVNLYDNTISAFTRKMNGRGWIVIHPEMLEREKLVLALMKHKG